MPEQPQPTNNEEYLQHYPGAVVDKEKAELMAYVESPYRDDAAAQMEEARVLGRVIIENENPVLGDVTLAINKETERESGGEAPTSKKRAIETLERKVAYGNHKNKAEWDKQVFAGRSRENLDSPAIKVNDLFDDSLVRAQESLDTGRKKAEELANKYDDVNVKINSVK